MKYQTAKGIMDAAQEIGMDSDRIQMIESYSGRGCYGDETIGIGYKDLGDLLACVSLAAVTTQYTDSNFPKDIIRETRLLCGQEFTEDLELSSTDSLGLGSVIY